MIGERGSSGALCNRRMRLREWAPGALPCRSRESVSRRGLPEPHSFLTGELARENGTDKVRGAEIADVGPNSPPALAYAVVGSAASARFLGRDGASMCTRRREAGVTSLQLKPAL